MSPCACEISCLSLDEGSWLTHTMFHRSEFAAQFWFDPLYREGIGSVQAEKDCAAQYWFNLSYRERIGSMRAVKDSAAR